MAEEINFTEKDFEFIKTQISNLFGEGTGDILKQKFLNIQNIIAQLKNQLQSALAVGTKQGQEHLAKLGYLTIMQIRKLLTGQEIIYELYMTNRTNTSVKVFQVNEEFLLEHSKLNGDALRLKGIIKDAEQQQKQDTIYQNIINSHINKIMTTVHFKDFKHDDHTYHAYIVIDDFFKIYYPNLNPKIGYTKNKQYLQIGFNMGNIMETADRIISNYLLDEHQSKMVVNSENLANNMNGINVQHEFLMHLAKDNVPGFKGGDNGLAQVKARNASIMQVNTIIKYLKQCDIILNEIINGTSNINELSNLIKTTFIDKDNTLSAIANETADRIVNEIIQGLKTPGQKSISLF